MLFMLKNLAICVSLCVCQRGNAGKGEGDVQAEEEDKGCWHRSTELILSPYFSLLKLTEREGEKMREREKTHQFAVTLSVGLY